MGGLLEDLVRGCPRRGARRRSSRACGRRAPSLGRGRGRSRASRGRSAAQDGGGVVEEVGARRWRRGPANGSSSSSTSARPRARVRGAPAAPRRPRACAAGRSASEPTPSASRAACAWPRRSARGVPHQPSAASTFASTLRRASAGVWSAAATRPAASIVPESGSDQPAERRQQSRLARAVRTEQRHDLAPAQLHVETSRDHGGARRGATRHAAGAAGRGSRHDGRRRAPAGVALLSDREPRREDEDEAEQDQPDARSRARTRRPRPAVSTALASVCVWPWMLPPTSTIAPTSENAEPSAAIAAASTPTRASRRASSRHAQPRWRRARAPGRAAPAGTALDGGGASERDDDRDREHRLGEDHRRRRCRSGAGRPSGAFRNSSSATIRPTTTGGSPRPAFADRERRAAPAEAPERRAARRSGGRSRARSASTRSATCMRHAEDARGSRGRRGRAGRPRHFRPSQMNCIYFALDVDDAAVREPVDRADALPLPTTRAPFSLIVRTCSPWRTTTVLPLGVVADERHVLVREQVGELQRGQRREQERDREHDAEVEQVDEAVERVAAAVAARARARGLHLARSSPSSLVRGRASAATYSRSDRSWP